MAAEYQARSHTQTQAVHHNLNQKAGLMDKIKENILGGHTHTQTGHTGHTAHSNPTQNLGLVDKFKGVLLGSHVQTSYSSSTQKLGLVNKIKEKIPRLQNK